MSLGDCDGACGAVMKSDDNGARRNNFCHAATFLWDSVDAGCIGKAGCAEISAMPEVVKPTFEAMGAMIKSGSIGEDTATTVKTDDVSSNTLRDFGFYYGTEPTGKLSDFSAFSTCSFVSDCATINGTGTVCGAGGGTGHMFAEALAQRNAAELRALQRQNMTGILPCGGVFRKNATTLRGNWSEDWARYWAIVSPHAAAISAFAPFDEPQMSQMAIYSTVVKAIHAAAPHIPIAAVVTQGFMVGIELERFDLPPEVSMVGFDAYGCWGAAECLEDPGHCCPEVGGMNRTVPENLGVLQRFAAKTNRKILIVGDGYGGTQTSFRPIATSKEEQAFKATINRRFHEWCEAEELCVAMWVFLWESQRIGTGGWVVGVDQMAEVLQPALVKIGRQIKNRVADTAPAKPNATAVRCPPAANGILYADLCGDGFTAVDSVGQPDHTAVLQAALNASDVHTIVLRNLSASTPWITNPLFLYESHRTIYFNGAFLLAKRGVACVRAGQATCFWGHHDSLLSVPAARNVSITGDHGATLRMWKWDYMNGTQYYKAEFRMGIYMGTPMNNESAFDMCEDMSIKNLRIENSGGDGIEVVNCRRVHIANVTCDGNYRQVRVALPATLRRSHLTSNTARNGRRACPSSVHSTCSSRTPNSSTHTGRDLRLVSGTHYCIASNRADIAAGRARSPACCIAAFLPHF
jgi:hypothetical protein